MEHIIEAINEYRQKLISRKDIDYKVAYLVDDYLRQAENNMQTAKRIVDEHKIEM